MKAITLGPQGLQYMEHPDKHPEQGQVKVRLKTAGLNHRDLFIIEGVPGPVHPCVLGSDGAGVIEETGEGVSGLAQGMEVIINPCLGWDRADEVPVVPDILGYPADGTLRNMSLCLSRMLCLNQHISPGRKRGVTLSGTHCVPGVIYQREPEAGRACADSGDWRRGGYVCCAYGGSGWGAGYGHVQK